MNSAENDSLTIFWRPTLADAYGALRLGFWGTPGRISRTLVLLLVFPTLVFGWLVHLVAGSQLSLVGLVGVAIASGLAWGVLFGLSFGAWLARSLVKAQQAKGNPQQIVIGSEAVERVLKDSRITYPWTAISSIEETHPAFILVGPEGPVASIEKSGITSDAELQVLRTFLRTKRPGKFFDDKST